MKNASFFYFDIINKVITRNDKFYNTFKIQPRFHAKGGFGNISMLQKYRFQIDIMKFGITFAQASNLYHSRLVPLIGAFEWLWPMD